MSFDREKSIFLAAIDSPSDSARQAYLAEACGHDPNLRRAVDELLAAHDCTTNVVDQQPDSCVRLREDWGYAVTSLRKERSRNSGSTESDCDGDQIGERIGPYRLMEKIGEGGFGQVFVAEQVKPLRRRVALKLLKPWMGSKEVIARFEAERQALAMMDHPNIARVFDAGTTSAGQPYFVMELVRGVPITDFCANHRLTIRQRLELFVDVCEAVQHAHQKGIIHRDLKPSNVMVTLHDARPVVKVIDFGVSKAVGEPLTDKTIYTRFTQLIGTPMYMSPEQAEMNALDVDTRSDVYSLGVMLYELLVGTTPFDVKRLNSVAFDELRRIIREEDPPRPSMRLTTLSASETAHLVARITEPENIASKLRGELDWIVMKALEKDRRRRYESTADLARDVRRYLDQQPVAARPSSRFYRLRKFAQRNKAMFAAASLVIVALVAGTAVSVWQAVRATNAYRETDALRRAAVDSASRLKEANVLLDSARANADEQRWNQAYTQYTRATELKPDHYLTWSGRGSLYARVGAWRAAEADFSTALKLGAPANNPAWWGVPQLCLFAGDEEAYRLICEALRKQLDVSGDPVFSMMAARGLLVRPIDVGEARALGAKLEQGLERRPPWGYPHEPSPSPDMFSRGSPKHPPDSGTPMGFRPMVPGGFIENFQAYAAGLAYYRAGEFQKALSRLNQAAEPNGPFPQSKIPLPVLAMTYHALGKTAEAEAKLAEAATAIDQWLSGFRNNDFGPWFDLVECLVLYREAYQHIKGESPPDNDRLIELERKSVTVLHVE